MTAAFQYFQTNLNIGQKQAKIFTIISKNQGHIPSSPLSDDKKFLYTILEQSLSDKHKDKFDSSSSIYDAEKIITQNHINTRAEYQKQYKKRQKYQNQQTVQILNFEQKKISIYVTANTKILQSQLISNYFILVDQPGLNQSFKPHNLKQIQNKQQSKIQVNKSKNKKNQKTDIIIQKYSDIQFTPGEIVIYCCSLQSGLLNADHQHLITKILQQNNLDSIIFGFNFIGSVRQIYELEDSTNLYHAMFYQIPKQMKDIAKRMIQNAQTHQYYQRFLTNEKIQKLNQFKQVVNQYLQNWEQISKDFNIKDLEQKAQFYQVKNKSLLKVFPFKYFHYYGFNKIKILAQKPIIKRINGMFNQNLKLNLQRKSKIIYDKCFIQIEQLFQKVKREMKEFKDVAYLSQQQRKEVSDYYQLVKQGLNRFQKYYENFQSVYKQNLNNLMSNLYINLQKKISQVLKIIIKSNTVHGSPQNQNQNKKFNYYIK